MLSPLRKHVFFLADPCGSEGVGNQLIGVADRHHWDAGYSWHGGLEVVEVDGGCCVASAWRREMSKPRPLAMVHRVSYPERSVCSTHIAEAWLPFVTNRVDDILVDGQRCVDLAGVASDEVDVS